MFDNDPRFEWTREAVRPKDPPVDVEVDLTLVLPPQRHRWGKETPIWCRAAGIGGDRVPGKLVAWVLSMTGDWWGLVEFEAVSRNGQTRVTLRQAVLPDALREVKPE